MIEVWGLRNCDGTRRAVRALEHVHEVSLRDVRETPLSEDEIARLVDAFGDSVVNRRSATWRGLPPAAREEAPEALLRAHPTLMKRPVIVADGRLFLGLGEEARKSLLSED